MIIMSNFVKFLLKFPSLTYFQVQLFPVPYVAWCASALACSYVVGHWPAQLVEDLTSQHHCFMLSIAKLQIMYD